MNVVNHIMNSFLEILKILESLEPVVSTTQRICKFRLTLPEFSGDIPSATDWLKNFRVIASAQHWLQDTRVRMFKNKLRGRAAD